jgi:hypothetical protein
VVGVALHSPFAFLRFGFEIWLIALKHGGFTTVSGFSHLFCYLQSTEVDRVQGGGGEKKNLGAIALVLDWVCEGRNCVVNYVEDEWVT